MINVFNTRGAIRHLNDSIKTAPTVHFLIKTTVDLLAKGKAADLTNFLDVLLGTDAKLRVEEAYAFQIIGPGLSVCGKKFLVLITEMILEVFGGNISDLRDYTYVLVRAEIADTLLNTLAKDKNVFIIKGEARFHVFAAEAIAYTVYTKENWDSTLIYDKNLWYSMSFYDSDIWYDKNYVLCLSNYLWMNTWSTSIKDAVSLTIEEPYSSDNGVKLLLSRNPQVIIESYYCKNSLEKPVLLETATRKIYNAQLSEILPRAKNEPGLRFIYTSPKIVNLGTKTPGYQ